MGTRERDEQAQQERERQQREQQEQERMQQPRGMRIEGEDETVTNPAIINR